MKAKYILVTAAVVLLIFGLGFLFSPLWVMNLFGVPLGPDGLLMTQLLGATFLGFAVLNWMTRTFTVAEDLRPIVLANFVVNAVGFVVALLQKLDGVGNVWSWIPIALFLLFALAFGYSYLVRSSIEEPRVRAKHA